MLAEHSAPDNQRWHTITYFGDVTLTVFGELYLRVLRLDSRNSIFRAHSALGWFIGSPGGA